MEERKKNSTASNAEQDLGDDSFMSAEQLRGYMIAKMAAKSSKEVDVVAQANKAREALVKSLSDPISPDEVNKVIKTLLFKLRKAAERGEVELMVMRFPHELCSDKGRAINNAEAGWPETLIGRPRQAYELWRDHLKALDYRLSATIVDWPGGLPGDVGFFLSWGKKD
jgi:hypothetical protein